MEAIATKVLDNGYTVNVYYEEYPESPREWCNVGTMACWHSRYNLGDEQPSAGPEDFWKEALEDIGVNVNCADCGGSGWSTEIDEDGHFEECETCDGYGDISEGAVWSSVQEHFVVLPLYLYDHGGITMSTGGLSCPWDSGKVGWIYTLKKKARHEWGEDVTDEQVAKYLAGEVETYAQYLEGSVYRYVVTDREGDHIASCYGFYGEVDYCLTEGIAEAKASDPQLKLDLFSEA